MRNINRNNIIIKWPAPKEDITLLNMYVLLSVINVFGRHKVSKDIVEMNTIVSQLYLIDIYGILHLMKTEYTFFSSSHGTFTKIEHLLGHKHS